MADIMGKKGGGGGGQSSQVQVPAGVFQTAATATGLGQYASSLLDPLASMTNWAAGLATGGQAGQIQSFRSQATQAGPNVDFQGKGKSWSTSFDPTTGLITFTNPGNARQTFTLTLDQAKGSGLPSNVLDQWGSAYSQNQASGGQGGTSATWGTIAQQYGFSQRDIAQFEAAGLTPQSMSQWGDVVKQGAYSWHDVINFKKAGLSPSQVASGAKTYQEALGPLLGQTWSDIQQQQEATGTLKDLMKESQAFTEKAGKEADVLQGEYESQRAAGTSLLNRGTGMIGQGEQMLTGAKGMLGRAEAGLSEGEKMLAEATGGTGLFPSQAKMIEAAKRTQEQNVEATLGGMGLGTSTQKEELKGQADLAAAAAGGSLVQGNIAAAQEQEKLAQGQETIAQSQETISQEQEKLGMTEQGVGISEQQVAQQTMNLSQAAQKLSLAGQELTFAEQGALVTELASIGSQSQEMQKTLWSEAMSGYGAIGQMLDSATKSYGLSLNAYKVAVDTMLQNAKTSEEAQASQNSADSSASSSLFGALGKILGGAGGAAAGGAAAGGTAAAAGGGSSITGIIGTVIGAIGSLFCWVAREVFGVDNPKWILFAEWMQEDAPRWLYDWYRQNGEWFAKWIHDKPLVKTLIRMVMEVILYGRRYRSRS